MDPAQRLLARQRRAPAQGLCHHWHACTVQRWHHPKCLQADRRSTDKRRSTTPPNKLSAAERRAALALLNSEAFNDPPPSQIGPRLADQGLYVASESTLYRLLREVGQLGHRRLERPAQKRSKPRTLVATGPDQVYCGDISYLPTMVFEQRWAAAQQQDSKTTGHIQSWLNFLK